MAVLSWGKPIVEIGILGADGAAPTKWVELPEIVQGTAQLNTEQGNKTEAIEEGGGIVDVRYEKNKYTFELELFIRKDDKKFIDDEDGVVTANYGVRLTPEDASIPGWIMDKVSVAVTETWTSADGGRRKYTFSGLKPDSGKILKPYTPAVG